MTITVVWKPPLAVVGVLICGCLLPAVASAANRYAEPAGDGAEPCAQTDPCDIVTAINNSTSGDDITLLSGTYSTSTTLGGAAPSTGPSTGLPGRGRRSTSPRLPAGRMASFSWLAPPSGTW